MSTPQFTVVIPTLNEEKFLPNLLASLAAQTKKNFDVIVVDGESEDRTVAVAKSYKKTVPGLSVIASRRGVSRQRNAGVRAAEGKWVVLVDADSVLMPGFFETVTRYAVQKNPACFTTWFKSDVDSPQSAILGLIINIGVEATLLTRKPWVPGPLAIMRRDVFGEIGGYNEDLVYGEDHEIGISLTKHGYHMDILREVLYVYSLRRFRKEGLFKVIGRTIRSDTMIAFADTGLKTMPGFISGGSLYEGKDKKKNFRIIPKETSDSLRRFMKELLQ